MSKNKEIVTVGYPIYKCRICEKVFYGGLEAVLAFRTKVVDQSLTIHGQEVMSRILRQGELPLTNTVDLYEVHNCIDGSKGLADLKGLGKIREALKDRRDNFVDPGTKVCIPTYID